MDSMPFCSIVIPALNEEESIAECLATLNNQSYPRDRYEIIVVDNGSVDRTKQIAQPLADKVLEKTGVNVGAVRNHGAKNALGDILICTDADCLVDTNWIQNGVNLLRNNPNHVFGGGLKPRNDATWIERYWLLNDDGNAIQQQDLMGSCIFCWKKDFVEVGGFNEEVTSGEDSELSINFKTRGYTVILSGELSLVHLGSPQKPIDFIKRQTWHSENYFKNIKASISDKIFWITALYTITTITFFMLLLVCNPFAINILIPNQALPLVLSLKRIKRSKQKLLQPTLLVKTLLLDNLYLIGRSIGLVKGIKNTFAH
jgi:glycosyltransferase involved in cell wall biosynthesis